MLKLKLLILWSPDVKSQLTGKDPDAGKDWREKKKGAGEKRWLDSITDSMDMNLSKRKTLEDRGAWHAAVHRAAKSQTWLSNWKTETPPGWTDAFQKTNI